MTIPDSVSQTLNWLLVVGLAYFAADSACAILENRLGVPPRPLPATATVTLQEEVPAQAPAPGLIALLATTKPEEPESEATAAGETPGTNQGTGTPKNPNVESSPKNLRLKGTMAGFGGAGLAMIEFNNETVVVSAGDEIAGYQLISVEPYSVTLESNGHYQILEMDVATDLNAPPVNPKPQSTEEPLVPAPEEQDPVDAEPAEEVGGILTQRELRNILDNPEKFAGQGFRMNPVLREGEIIGMQVALPDASHPLARLGLKHGDIVRTLNGQELNGPEALTSIYRVLRNTSSLRFEIERNGQNESIDVALSE